jgi:hypothetical protein
MTLFFPSLAAVATALAVEGKPVPDEAARQTAARVRASMLTGDWTWLDELDDQDRNPILEGLGRWVLVSPSLEFLALRLDVLTLAMNAFTPAPLVTGADWKSYDRNARWLGSVPSWGPSPFGKLNSIAMDDDFWSAVIDQVAKQESGLAEPLNWSHIRGWSWDGDRGLLLVEREDVDPPRHFVVTPIPKIW